MREWAHSHRQFPGLLRSHSLSQFQIRLIYFMRVQQLLFIDKNWKYYDSMSGINYNFSNIRSEILPVTQTDIFLVFNCKQNELKLMKWAEL